MVPEARCSTSCGPRNAVPQRKGFGTSLSPTCAHGTPAVERPVAWERPFRVGGGATPGSLPRIHAKPPHGRSREEQRLSGSTIYCGRQLQLSWYSKAVDQLIPPSSSL